MTQCSFRILDLPFDIRHLIFEWVLLHEHQGFLVDGGRAPWTELSSFSEKSRGDKVFLQQHDWPHAGLLLCNRQIASEVALVISNLRRRPCAGEQRRLNIHKAFIANAFDPAEYFLTWEGPSWISCNSACPTVRFSGCKLKWRSNSEDPNTITPPILCFHIALATFRRIVCAYFEFGPRFRSSLRPSLQEWSCYAPEGLKLDFGYLSEFSDPSCRTNHVFQNQAFLTQQHGFLLDSLKAGLRNVMGSFPEYYGHTSPVRVKCRLKLGTDLFEIQAPCDVCLSSGIWRHRHGDDFTIRKMDSEGPSGAAGT